MSVVVSPFELVFSYLPAMPGFFAMLVADGLASFAMLTPVKAMCFNR
jgi:hypothetical protein